MATKTKFKELEETRARTICLRPNQRVELLKKFAESEPKKTVFASKETLSLVDPGKQAKFTELNPTEAEAAPPYFDNEYELMGILGRGKRTVVYKAKPLRRETISKSFFSNLLGRAENENLYALKVLKGNRLSFQEVSRLFQREAVALLSCRSKNVVELYDFVEVPEENTAYLLMEYAPHGDLGQLLQRKKSPLNVNTALGIVIQLLNGVQAVHDAGMVHRDIKPSNVLIANSGVIKLADFGVVKFPRGPIDADREDITGIGTCAYLSPETLEFGANTVVSDLYGVGVTLYQLLTGVLPFQCYSLVGEIEAKLEGSRKTLQELVPSIPQELEEVINKALNPLPSLRYQSAKEFRHDLVHLLYDLRKESNAEQAVQLELSELCRQLDLKKLQKSSFLKNFSAIGRVRERRIENEKFRFDTESILEEVKDTESKCLAEKKDSKTLQRNGSSTDSALNPKIKLSAPGSAPKDSGGKAKETKKGKSKDKPVSKLPVSKSDEGSSEKNNILSLQEVLQALILGK